MCTFCLLLKGFVVRLCGGRDADFSWSRRMWPWSGDCETLGRSLHNQPMGVGPLEGDTPPSAPYPVGVLLHRYHRLAPPPPPLVGSTLGLKQI